MQEEAVRRVREMQKRSRQLAQSDLPPMNAPPQTNARQEHNDGQGDHNGHNEHDGRDERDRHEQQDKKDGHLFSIAGIDIDEEKALIALLLYILYKNKADTKLMMALAYLLL